MNQYIKHKKQRRERRKIQEQPWTYLAIFLILLLIILGYIVIKKLQQ
ncbi:hypothetical protein [Paraflavitalea speifideaquila]|nr:hypothetical protein [Paraflavitalea speifideiaquila]